MSVVIVGGGFGALEVALAIKSADRDIPVRVVTTETTVVYRPWLIHLPAGKRKPTTILSAQLLARAGVEVTADRAASADLARRVVILESGTELPYDQLVVATGAVSDRDRVSGSRAGALFPCEEADATELATRIDQGATEVAIVFGWERPGPGLEYAAWIAAHRSGVRVTTIDGDGTLERRFGPKATAWLRQLYESRGARLLEGRVESIGDGQVSLANGERVATEVIAVATPLRGGTDWLPAELLDPSARVRIDNAMAVRPGVFAIGDVVSVPDGYRLSPALRSIQGTSRGVAGNLVRALRGEEPLPVLKPGTPDIMGPDLAGTAMLVRDGRLVMRGRLPLFIRSLGERRYLRSRGAT